MCKTTERAELLLPMTHHASGTAREFARASHCTDHAGAVLDEALLLMTELVTNAVRHGQPPILVAVECQGDGLKVRVRDGSTVLPQQRHAGDEDESGRGLTLVAQLSAAWGVEPVQDEHGGGKAVWFELQPPLMGLPGAQDIPDANDLAASPESSDGTDPRTTQFSSLPT